MIRSFRDKATAMVFSGGVPRGMARDLDVSAARKLVALNAVAVAELPSGARIRAEELPRQNA